MNRLTPREHVRRLRLYYRSNRLFHERLENPQIARWLPWQPGGRMVELRFRSGRSMRMPARQWPLLPSACRLERIGAEFEFLEDAKRVRVDGLTMYSPLWARDEASYYQEVFLDDAYGVRNRDLAGCTVVDVGAYVGDSSIAFARQGASVHAFEPSETFCRFIRRNLSENGLAGRVVLYEVGLAERAQTVATRHDRLQLVEGVAYALGHLPRGIELLKLDCEGSEYHLLGDPRFLDHLAPREIRLEYHRGLEGIAGPLDGAGYEVKLAGPPAKVGLLTARRKT